ncbi:unnamed protein product [Camellia sinensis]
MKIMNKFTPKQLFRLKKTRSVTRADPSSYSYCSSSSDSTDSSSIHKPHLRKSTPTSVLRSRSTEISEISADLSDISSDVYSAVVQAFNMIDKDGDGKITRKPLGALLSRVGTKPVLQLPPLSSPTPWTASGPKLGPTVSVCECCVHTNNTTTTNNDDDGDDSSDDDEDDGENQVVPLALMAPPPGVSSSSSSEESSRRESIPKSSIGFSFKRSGH